MNKKGVNFLEQHIEKIVLAIVGLGCFWLLITRAFISPNYVEYDNKKFNAGDIDVQLSEQTKILEDRLNLKPEPKQPYKPRFNDYTAKIDSAIDNIDTTVYLPVPPAIAGKVVKSKYHIPQIGDVNDVEVEHIRAVAYNLTEWKETR